MANINAPGFGKTKERLEDIDKQGRKLTVTGPEPVHVPTGRSIVGAGTQLNILHQKVEALVTALTVIGTGGAPSAPQVTAVETALQAVVDAEATLATSIAQAV